MFYCKRYGYALATIIPILIGCVLVVTILNVLDSYGVSQQAQDSFAIIGMLLLMIALGIVILAREPLPGLLGSWQKFWNKIPTWKRRIAERTQEKKR